MGNIVTYKNEGRKGVFSQIKLNNGERVLISIAANEIKIYKVVLGGLVPSKTIWSFPDLFKFLDLIQKNNYFGHPLDVLVKKVKDLDSIVQVQEELSSFVASLESNQKKDFYDPLKDESLKDKPFTRNLLLRTIKFIQDTDRDLKKRMPGIVLEDTEIDKTLEKLTITSTVTVANEITRNSLSSNIDPIILNSTTDKKIPIVVAFSLFCLIALKTLLKEEHIETDLKKLEEHQVISINHSKRRP